MQQDTTFVGLDAHKDSILMAMLLPGETKAVEWQIVHDGASVRKAVKKMLAEAKGRVVCCYEVGPCRYALQRNADARERPPRERADKGPLAPDNATGAIRGDRRGMQGVDWKRVVELASAGEMLPGESLDRASRSLDTWRPDVDALPAVARDLGLSQASRRPP